METSVFVLVLAVILIALISLSYSSARQAKDIRACYNYLHEKYPEDFITFANRPGSRFSKGCTVIAAVSPALKFKELWLMKGTKMTDEMLEQQDYTGKKVRRYILKNETPIPGVPTKQPTLVEVTMSDTATAAERYYQNLKEKSQTNVQNKKSGAKAVEQTVLKDTEDNLNKQNSNV